MLILISILKEVQYLYNDYFELVMLFVEEEEEIEMLFENYLQR